MKTVKYRIELGSLDKKPISQFCSALTGKPAERKDEIEKMIEQKVDELTQADWASSIMFTLKKDRTLRFPVDYSKLNAVPIWDEHSISWMDDCIKTLGDATILATMDTNRGCWHVQFSAEDSGRTAVKSHLRIFRFTHAVWIEKCPLEIPRRIGRCTVHCEMTVGLSILWWYGWVHTYTKAPRWACLTEIDIPTRWLGHTSVFLEMDSDIHFCLVCEGKHS